MAEPATQTTPNEKTGEAPNRARSGDGERRSFQDEARDRTAEAARAAGQAGRELAESTHRGLTEASDAWRQSFDPFMALQMDFGRMFDDFWRRASGFGPLPALRPARPFGALSTTAFNGMPPADLKETDGGYRLSVELPGLDKEDVELSVRDGALIISGHKAEEKDEGGASYRMSERRYGRFERSFPLPQDIDREKIGASFRNGLLTIELPKSEAARARHSKIEIR